MGVTPGYLESVATFYDLFRMEPQGEHQVLVCTNISCWLRGARPAAAAFNEAADDDVFVRNFECMGACDIAPMASIDERYYGPLEEGDAATAVEQLRKSSKDVLPRSVFRTGVPRRPPWVGRQAGSLATPSTRALARNKGKG